MVSLAPRIPMNDGHSIPQIGLGTWPLDDDAVAEAIVEAVQVGYRHIDTAAKYGNERGVGVGVASTGLARDELFVTTKLDGQFQGHDRAIAGLDASLDRLNLDYVDLLLIHWPLPERDEYVSTFRTFEKLLNEGKTRSIGVSNFKPAHLDTLFAETSVVPAVNQIQLSPAIQRREQRAFDEAHGIVTESWTPIKGVLGEAVVEEVAEKHDRTPAQVVLRWHVQNGLVVIPKSGDPARMAQNLDIFGFELDPGDIAKLDTLDLGPDAGVDSDVDGH